jgi:hypothetical protein
VVGISGLELSLPPVGTVILEYVEYVVHFDGQLILGVGVIVVEGDADVEERHGCARGYASQAER